MNITEANAVNHILRAWLDPDNAPDGVGPAAVLLAEKANKVLGAGYRPEEVAVQAARWWQDRGRGPILVDTLQTPGGEPTFRFGPNLDAILIRRRDGTAQFLMRNGEAEDFQAFVGTLSDVALEILHHLQAAEIPEEGP